MGGKGGLINNVLSLISYYRVKKVRGSWIKDKCNHIDQVEVEMGYGGIPSENQLVLEQQI